MINFDSRLTLEITLLKPWRDFINEISGFLIDSSTELSPARKKTTTFLYLALSFLKNKVTSVLLLMSKKKWFLFILFFLLFLEIKKVFSSTKDLDKLLPINPVAPIIRRQKGFSNYVKLNVEFENEK